MEVRKFIQQRKKELLQKSDDSVRPLVLVGFNFIEDRMAENFDSVTPEMTRNAEMLEALFISFISHCIDFSKLKELDELVNDIKCLGRHVQ